MAEGSNYDIIALVLAVILAPFLIAGVLVLVQRASDEVEGVDRGIRTAKSDRISGLSKPGRGLVMGGLAGAVAAKVAAGW